MGIHNIEVLHMPDKEDTPVKEVDPAHVAPDADEKGDEFPEALKDLVAKKTAKGVKDDNVDRKG